MKQFIPFIILCTFIISSCSGAKQNSASLPVIDLTAQYPKKDIILQEIADVEYISLNSKGVPLMGTVQIGYVSDDCFILYDFQNGDVFVLANNGTIRNHFNLKGNSGKEYTRISHLTYDPQKREIYILDPIGPNGILVYTETGIFVRNYPEFAKQNLSEIYNFDNQSLLAYFRSNPRASSDDLNQSAPYVFISKETGEIESRLPLRFPERLSSIKPIMINGQYSAISIAVSPDSRKFGNDFIIADLSSDTLYTLSSDRQITAVMYRTPSVYKQKPFFAWSVGLKTDNFICINTAEYDFESIEAAAKNDQPMPQMKTEGYLYYFQSHEIVIPRFINTDWTSSNANVGMFRVSMDEKNMSANIFQADKLLDALKKGKLTGKLNEVAQTLTSDGNPVLMLVRYK